MLVLGHDGQVSVAPRPLGRRTALAAGAPGAAAPAATAAAPRKTVIGELKRLLAAGAIDVPTYQARRAAYEDAKRAVRKLSGRRRVELGAVVRTLEGIAARGALTASRLPAAVADARAQPPVVDDRAAARLRPARRLRGLRARLAVLPRPGASSSSRWRTSASSTGSGRARSTTTGSARCSTSCWRSPSSAPAASPGSTTSRSTAAGRRGSASLAQGTALQALARAAIAPAAPGRRLAGRAPRRWHLPHAAARRACAVPSPSGGAHYLQYSFDRRLYILNGFIQSLNGLATTPAGQRPDGAGAVPGRRRRPRGPRCRRSTPAHGRCTRAATTRTSPTSATTSCCATS